MTAAKCLPTVLASNQIRAIEKKGTRRLHHEGMWPSVPSALEGAGSRRTLFTIHPQLTPSAARPDGNHFERLHRSPHIEPGPIVRMNERDPRGSERAWD